MKIIFSSFTILIIFLLLPGIQNKLSAQITVNRDTVFVAAREIIKETTYCALVTIDSTGQPQVRTMNPFPVTDDFIIWFATSRSSRKVREIKNNPKVCVYYADHKTAIGYVNINGTAEVIDDRDLLFKMKRDYWDVIPDWQSKFVLIRVVPKSIEVINYKHGLNNDPVTFKAPSIIY
jgi:general stress protein 26